MQYRRTDVQHIFPGIQSLAVSSKRAFVMNRLSLQSPVVALIVLCQPSSAVGPFHILVHHLPDDANTLVLFNVEAIMATPLAQKEKWRERHDNMFTSGLILVPPQANQFAMASQMDVETMQPHWNAAVANVTYEPQMLKVTERYGGNVDEIDGQDAAVLPNERCCSKGTRRFAPIDYTVVHPTLKCITRNRHGRKG